METTKRRKSWLRRALALVLCLTLCLSVTQMMVYADGISETETNTPEGSMVWNNVAWGKITGGGGTEVKAGESIRTTVTIEDTPETGYQFLEDQFLGLSPKEIQSIDSIVDKDSAYAAVKISALKKNEAEATVGVKGTWFYEVSDGGKTCTVTYTYSDEDETIWNAIADKQDYQAGVICVPLLIKKLPEDMECATVKISINSFTNTNTDSSQWVAHTDGDNVTTYYVDRKSAGLDKAIVPYDSETTLGSDVYKSDAGVIWLEPKQKAQVQIAINYDEGIFARGILAVNDYLPYNDKWSDGFGGGLYSTNGILADSAETAGAITGITCNIYTADWMRIYGLSTSNFQKPTTKAFGAKVSKLPVSGTVIFTYCIQAPDQVDDPDTTEVETQRLFYSNASLLNVWQQSTPTYQGTEAVLQAFGEEYHLNASVYTEEEWLQYAPEFVIGLRDSSVKDGSLNVSKTVTGEGDLNQEFTFTLSLKTEDDANLPGTYSIVLADGSSSEISNNGTFTLKSGESVTISGIPAGTKYAVSEEEIADYTFTKTNDTGVIASETESKAVFVADKESNTDTQNVDIVGEKTLSGDKTTADITAGQFTFKVASDANNNADGFTGLNDTASVKAGGAIDFGTLTFSKEGTYKFTITENDLGKAGYTYDKTAYCVKIVVTPNERTQKLETVTTISKLGEGDTQDETVNAITFANTYKKTGSDIPKTGDNSNFGLWIALLVLSAMGIFVCRICERSSKMKKRKCE